jgi:hypothetical protein
LGFLGERFVENLEIPTGRSTRHNVEISIWGFEVLMVSTNTPGQLLLQDFSITRRRSKEGDLRKVSFLSLEPFSLEAIRGMPYHSVSILEVTSKRSIRSIPRQEVPV